MAKIFPQKFMVNSKREREKESGRSMPTYRNIQEYVKREIGCTVKTCWIAHVKELCGLKTRTAPNRHDLVKRINPCPPDKIDYIKRAFVHFRMLKQ